jgi:hypothetical protein
MGASSKQLALSLSVKWEQSQTTLCKMKATALALAIAICFQTIYGLSCPALTPFTTGAACKYGSAQNVDMSTLPTLWASYSDVAAKPAGYDEEFKNANSRYGKIEVKGFANCASHVMVAKMANGWCSSTKDCLLFGTQKKFNWGGTRKGYYLRHPLISPAPTAVPAPDFGQCLISSPDSGSSSNYKLVDYGAMILTFHEPTTRKFSVTIGDLDGKTTGGAARELGAVFGIDSTGTLVQPTAVLGSEVAGKTADLTVADGEALGLDMTGGVRKISVVEASSTAGAAPADAKAQVQFTFDRAIQKLVFLSTWASGPTDLMKPTNPWSGYTVFVDTRFTSFACAVPCKQTYNATKSMVCDPRQALFDILEDATSTRQCHEMNYCDTCDGVNKVKLSSYVPPGQFFRGTGPPNPPI